MFNLTLHFRQTFRSKKWRRT